MEEITRETGLSFEDILLYADDILIICQTQSQIRKCIEVVERWSEQNGMELNKKKSAVLPFSPRMAKEVPLMRLENVYDKSGKQYTKSGLLLSKKLVESRL